MATNHPDYDQCQCPDTLAHRAAVRTADLAAKASQSSGRWDATGSFAEAVNERRELARNWASSLSLEVLHGNIVLMARDPEAFTLYERTALLETVAQLMGNELKERRKYGLRF